MERYTNFKTQKESLFPMNIKILEIFYELIHYRIYFFENDQFSKYQSTYKFIIYAKILR